MTTETEYHPDTCWTAKQLRELGFKIPDSIPDCGWVTKQSCEMGSSVDFSPPSSSESFSLKTELKFTEPFRWIEVDAVVEKKDET